MNASTENRRILDPLEQHRPAIACAMLLYEAGQQACEEIARFFESLLAGATPPLSGALRFAPVKDAAWPQALGAAVEGDRKIEQWTGIELSRGVPFYPTDLEGRAAPQCAAVLGARHLLDDSLRQVLVAQLAKEADAYSRFLIFFLAGEHEMPFDADETQFHAWIREFAALAPKPVVLYCACPELSDGRPVARRELAEAIAVALFADLVIARKGAPRILTDTDDGQSITLHAIGIKGALYDPDAAADSLKASVASELMEQHLLAPQKENGRKPRCIRSPREVLAGLNLNSDGVVTRVFGQDQPPSITPALRGKNYALGFDFNGAALPAMVGNQSFREWPQLIQTARNFLASATVPCVGSRIKAALTEARVAEMGDAIDQAVEALVQEGISAAEGICQEIKDGLATLYWTDDAPQVNSGDSVDRRSAELEQAVSNVPSAARLAMSALLRFAPFAALAVLVRVLHLRFQTAFYCVSALGAMAASAHLAWRHHRAWRVARNAARHLADEVQRELRASLNALVRQCISAEMNAALAELEKMQGRLRRIREAAMVLEDHGTGLLPYHRSKPIAQVPWDEHQLAILQTRIQEVAGLGKLRAEARQLLADLGPRVLRGDQAPESLSEGFEALAKESCRIRFRRMRLSEFLDATDDTLSWPAFVSRNGENHSPFAGNPLVFMQNIALREYWSHPNRIRSALLVPKTFTGVLQNGEAEHSSNQENLLAAIVRVELAHIADSMPNTHQRKTVCHGKP